MLTRSRAHRPRQPQLRRICAVAAARAGATAPATMAGAGHHMAFHTNWSSRQDGRLLSRARSSRTPAHFTQPTTQSIPASIPTRCRGAPFSTTPRRQAIDTRTAAAVQPATPLPDLDRVAVLVTGARDRLLSHPGIPSENDTATALRICAEAADLVMEKTGAPVPQAAGQTASTLLSLDKQPVSSSSSSSSSASSASSASSPVINLLSDAAFAIVDDPRVFLTPALLEQYVHIQARLGRPESLPRVLELYASKPTPRSKTGAGAGADASSIVYSRPNPGRPGSAVAPEVADTALDAALAAKNLDAAVGVVEYTYAAPAFIRNKLLRRGFLPAFVVVGVPLATYSLAQQLAAYQQTMETTTATGLAFAAILAYIGFTGMIGVVANTTSNDQMRRVTWAPGTPLRERWLREEERAALDQVACAFGFREAHRYGEEEGAEFQALREYIMRKGMLMDQVELMEGMSS